LVNRIELLSNSIYSYNKLNNVNLSSDYNNVDISTPIAMMTTAYARIYMSEFKIKYADHLYYSDTDSIVLSCPLPDHLVGDKLGLHLVP